jgi:hypothetical protein
MLGHYPILKPLRARHVYLFPPPFRLPKPHAGTAPVLVEKFDSGLFKCKAERLNGSRLCRQVAANYFEAFDGRQRDLLNERANPSETSDWTPKSMARF